MKTKKRIFFPSTPSDKFESIIPVECPHCGAFSTPQIVSYSSFSYSGMKVWTFIFHNDCCDKKSFAVYKIQDKEAEFLGILPPVRKLPQLPTSMLEISPRFVNLYSQSFNAEQNSYFELAGSGYRNAIEVLIKDFAINELNCSTKEVCKKSLSQAIEEYLPNINASISADVMRALGNDYTHYERKYEDVDFQVLKRYLQIFINSIDCEYLIRHPVVPTNPKLTQQQ